MSRTLKRRLLEVKTARKKIKCKSCHTYIWKGQHYTHCTIIGFWGSYHDACFDRLSVNLETKDTGEVATDSSKVAFQQGISKRIDVLKKGGER